MNQPTQKQIAEALGITPRRVSTLKNEGMPVTSIEAAEAWRTERADTGDAAELRKQRIRLTKAKADAAEHALEIQRGRYIDRAEIKEDHQRNGAALTAALIALENALPPLGVGLDEAGMQKAFRPAIRQILKDLNDAQGRFWLRRPEPDRGEAGDAEAWRG